MKEWGATQVQQDVRWQYGTPPTRNANYAWGQHMIHHLKPNGIAGFVLANGSMSTQTQRGGQHPQGYRRGRSCGLYGGTAGAVSLHHADSRVPVVSGTHPRPLSQRARGERPGMSAATGAARPYSLTRGKWVH